jgi:hypothetical protein
VTTLTRTAFKYRVFVSIEGLLAEQLIWNQTFGRMTCREGGAKDKGLNGF